MPSLFVAEFLVILGLGLLGAAAILPYAFSLAGDKLLKAKLPLPALALISFLQTVFLIALASGLGLLAANSVGVGAPYIQADLSGKLLPGSVLELLPLVLGLAAGTFAVMALLERYVFAPHLPEALRNTDVNIPLWKRFLASFYGGFDEEILMRLFLVSGIVWILGRIWQTSSGIPANGAYWTAILLTAVLFGLGHLPATSAITPLTSVIILRAIVLNGIAGIAFGWLYWQHGLEAAMLCHFSVDILLHVIAPLFATGVQGGIKKTEAQPDPK